MSGRPVRLVVGFAIGAAMLAGLTSAQICTSRRLEAEPASIARILPVQAVDWFAWAALGPILVIGCERVFAARRSAPLRTVLLAAAALLTSFTHTVIEVAI